MAPLWSILVCKIPQFWVVSYRFRQLIILFQKVDTLRLLKIDIVLSTVGSQILIFSYSSSWTTSFESKFLPIQFRWLAIKFFFGLWELQRSHVFSLNLISTNNPSIDKSVFSNYEGISSLIYSSRMPPPFALTSNMGLHNLLNKIVLKENKNQFLFQISKVHQYFC